MITKQLVLTTMLSLTLIVQAGAEDLWATDFSKAQARAQAENKLLLIYFTGSDW